MTETATMPVTRFAQGEEVTVLGIGEASIATAGNAPISLRVQLPDGRMLVAGPGWPGVTLIHGDIRPTLLQALRDAIAYHHDGDCGDPEHLGWVENYERAVDVLEAAGK